MISDDINEKQLKMEEEEKKGEPKCNIISFLFSYRFTSTCTQMYSSVI